MEIIPVYEVFNPITALNTIEEFIKNSGLFPFFLIFFATNSKLFVRLNKPKE